MEDNKVTDVYRTTDIRPACRRATSVYIYIYIDISVHKRRVEPKQRQNIFRYPMLAHKDRRNSRLMRKLQWDEENV